MANVGEARQSGYAKRLARRTIKDEEVDLSKYIDYHDAYRTGIGSGLGLNQHPAGRVAGLQEAKKSPVRVPSE
jgi:hypothetical protein